MYNNLHVQVMTWWESFSIFNLYNSMHLITLSHHPRLILWSYHIIEYERDLIHIKIPYHIVIWCAYYDHYDRITTLKMTKGPHTYHYHITISYYHMYHIKILSFYDHLKLIKGPDAPSGLGSNLAGTCWGWTTHWWDYLDIWYLWCW